MLTFLRKVRRRLISENRITRYLAYAIGEIILVVLGILIAIQLNAIKQQGDANAEMNKLLVAVHRDLLADSARLAEVNEYYLHHAKGIQDLVKLQKGLQSMGNDELGRSLLGLFFYDNYDKVNTTYESMISAGKMQYLNNKELSDLIIQYYTEDGIAITTEVYGEILVSFDPYINESQNLIADDRLLPNYILKRFIPDYDLVADSTLKSDFRLVMQEPWVDDFLVNCLNQLAYVFGSLNSEIELNKELRALIIAHLVERDGSLDSL